ncbi:hypothetical protein HN789_05545 [archaeon]|jgi:heme A synthase|nr:hypothetical protein [archaeon]MBT4022977.1 hypothetical protein [archaeon]MBT4271968.1 hypothetical protein [archaeon]MBT4461806.1 hypothetical protein [archaeon]MBT5424064.1 hypothetical protein [archaeon]
MISDIAKSVLFLNFVFLVFLLLVYVRKIKFNKEKQKFLFGLLFMVIILMVQTFYGILYVMQANELFVITSALLTVGLAGLLTAELAPLKRYLREYKKK